MFNLFKKPIKGTGAIEDKPDIRDYKAEEIAMFFPVQWQEKKINEWRRFPIFDQNGSASCVAQSTAKLLGIENYLEEGKFIHFSARDLYARRTNKPQAGMNFREAMEIGNCCGATVEQLMPSQKLNEVEMNKYDDRTFLTEEVAKIGKGGDFISLPIDIDRIAFTIRNRKKGVMIGIRFDNNYNKPVPELPKTPLYHHAIVAIDYTLWQGKKALIIEDSWGTQYGFEGQRVILEDWFKAGLITAAWYYEDLKNLPVGEVEKPKYQFKLHLKVGSQNEEVKKLKICLAFEKDEQGVLFPLIETNVTNYFGGICRNAIQRFQKKYGLAQNGEVDQTVRDKLNSIFK